MNLRLSSLPLVALLLVSASASAEPLNTWGLHPGKGVFGLTPYLYAGGSTGIQPLVYGEYGVTDDFALAGAVLTTVARRSDDEAHTWSADGSLDGLEIMPRYFVHPTTAIVGRVNWTPSKDSMIPGVEVHGTYELTEKLQLTVNAQWAPVVQFRTKLEGAKVPVGFVNGSWRPNTIAIDSHRSASPGTLGVIVAPEWFFTEKFSAYLELTPIVDVTRGAGTFADRFYFEAVPGVSFNVADEHDFSVGFGIPLTGFTTDNLYGGMWYSHAWGGDEKPEEKPEETEGDKPTATASN